jgi:hypothetical protein
MQKVLRADSSNSTLLGFPMEATITTRLCDSRVDHADALNNSSAPAFWTKGLWIGSGCASPTRYEDILDQDL